MTDFRFPSPTDRTAVVGSTGSGKTFAATWLLLNRNFTKRPWTIIDFKRDELLNSIGAEVISPAAKPPKKPGLYIMHPVPDVHDALVELYLKRVWAQEYHGIYIDEGYMVPRQSQGLKACLTQGRSKRIEMILLSQRPRWCNPFMFSEADHHMIFRLNRGDDVDTVQKNMSMDISQRLPKYHSYWYDVGRDRGFTMGPVPDRDELEDGFRRRLNRSSRML